MLTLMVKQNILLKNECAILIDDQFEGELIAIAIYKAVTTVHVCIAEI